MREALGGLSIFQIVILFIFIFVGIMCLTINHSKAFGVKDEIINILEMPTNNVVKDGYDIYDFTDDTGLSTIISDKLTELGYRTTGSCPDSSYTGIDRNGNITSSDDALYCIRIINVAQDAFYTDASSKCTGSVCTAINPSGEDYPAMIYYDVVLFYRLDIPILKYILSFNVKSSTKIIYEIK